MAFIRKMIIFGVIAALGIFLLVGGIRDKIELSKPITDVSTVTPDDLYAGQFVEGTIYELWNEYAYLQETDKNNSNGKVTAHYFCFPMQSTFTDELPKFLTLRVSDTMDYQTALVMERESDSFYSYGTEPSNWTEIEIKGKVSKLDKELLQFHKEYIAECLNITEAEAEQYICPYMITSSYGDTTPGLIMGIVFTVIGLGFMVFFIIRKIISGK